MTYEEWEEIINYRGKFEPCPRCESDDIEFVFNVLDPTAGYNYTACCRSCEYTMHDNDHKQLFAKWNEMSAHGEVNK